ncbi:cyclic pyranopterin phosphate synthase [Ilumatobacter fluminis]|uniref:GTP 3',8-cyclase n=1 Tax=Ilumatobacter fluminis TaxID=467091 RepID=A0A4R7HWW1_9ACTN|nr:GTP 3',8-cyclase MoaA [Ilumatobacter fluminis]TDT15531.1 cyclic pyranopterin phosphate synthase [Ilumatobacter fluminis]
MGAGEARDLVDPYGRVVRDLRIAVTDRCNFRCTYCMPEEGMEWMPRSEILTFEEITRVARICVEQYGFTGIRLTGGEPTIRAHFSRLVSQLSGLGIDVAMTTNAATLRNTAHDLHAAGLNRINISLDTLDREKFERMTRRDELENVLAGIDAAIDAGFEPVKINAVIERGVNDDELVDLARFGRDTGVEVRFIEFMPLDATDEWQRSKVVGQDEIVARLSEVWELEQVPARGAAPADRWRYTDGGGLVGVIPTVTKPFCGDCDRVRLTADGQLRTCLFSTDEFDLRAALRDGETDEQIAARIEAAVGTKWAGHQINQVNFIRPKRNMSQIGG